MPLVLTFERLSEEVALPKFSPADSNACAMRPRERFLRSVGV
jgi:hypothetical protein